MSADNDLGIDTLARLVAALPQPALEHLREGPLPDDGECRVCDTMALLSDWLGHDDRAEEVQRAQESGGDAYKQPVDAWMAAFNARCLLETWHDPLREPASYQPLLDGITDAAHAAGLDPASGVAMREAFAREDGTGEDALQDLFGRLAHARCHLIYLLAGWRP